MNNTFWTVLIKNSFLILTIVIFIVFGIVLKIVIGDPEELAAKTPIVQKAVELINENQGETEKLEEFEKEYGLPSLEFM